MSYHVFFSFSVGLAHPMIVPQGTLEACRAHVERVENTLGFKRTKYLDNPEHWVSTRPMDSVTDKVFCHVATQHNAWVRMLYELFREWSEAAKNGQPIRGEWKPRLWPGKHDDLLSLFSGRDASPFKTEVLSPEDAQTFWRGLVDIPVPSHRWTRSLYVDRMEHAYEVLRGRESEGVTLNCKKPLTVKQAAAVICLFSEWLDSHDMRLDVRRGYDDLTSSYDGGHDWCEQCGAVDYDDARNCTTKACPFRAEEDENADHDERRRWVVKDKASGIYLGTRIDVWPSKLGKAVLHFDRRADADRARARFTKRKLVVVPVRKR
jgi:hypothetical protein